MIAVILALGLIQEASPFDHQKHTRLFPSCTSCHAGAAPEGAGAPLWPASPSCASCHDGSIRPVVTWRVPAQPRVSNLRFNHQSHAAAAKAEVTCISCHTEVGAPRMAVQTAVVRRCLDCHAIRTAHLAAPDTACATCHVSLARATRFTRQDVARFPTPPSHSDPRWPNREGHGAVSRISIEKSCATCHAREFCYQCHAGGSPPRAVAALASDPRSTAIAVRRAPVSHAANFADRHGSVAAASTTTCASCHIRQDCLECHRPAAAAPAYHAVGFLARHPAAAYARETSCSDCHSERSFCTACHEQSGLVAARGLRTAYHDARQFFIAGHGGAARQNLESCATCHTERDCLQCHSSLGGRRFNPHGPGFDATRLRRKNFEMCTVCHGSAVPR